MPGQNTQALYIDLATHNIATLIKSGVSFFLRDRMNIHHRVSFAAPKSFGLNTQDFLYADMHCHTKYSDAYTNPFTLVKKAHRLGVGLAITDHNDVRGSIETSKNMLGVPVIPGMEMGVKEGPHLLTYFYNMREMIDFYEKHVRPFKAKNPSHNLSLSIIELLQRIDRYNCVVALAHPFAPSYLNLFSMLKQLPGTKQLLRKVNAVEVVSGSCLRNMNIRSVELCKVLHKSFIGGSDCHVASAFGNVLTYSRAGTTEEFMENILDKDNFIVGREYKIVGRLRQYSSVTAKHLQYPTATLGRYYDYNIRRNFKQIKPKIIQPLLRIMNGLL